MAAQNTHAVIGVASSRRPLGRHRDDNPVSRLRPGRSRWLTRTRAQATHGSGLPTAAKRITPTYYWARPVAPGIPEPSEPLTGSAVSQASPEQCSDCDVLVFVKAIGHWAGGGGGVSW